ncbi:MAG: HD domain-containing protein [Bacteroidia bacterium]|nr:HD domain-containing protein [Bacteroidia bacterium]
MFPLPEQYIELLQRTPQNPRYHAEGNVYIHTLRVLEMFEEYKAMNEVSGEDSEVLYWASILHDIGKPFVTKWKENRWTAKGHEDAGVPHAREILLKQKEISTKQRMKILNLVRWHHIPLNWMLNQVPLSQFYAISTSVDLKQVGLFGSFDIKGRDCQKKEEIVKLSERFNAEIIPSVDSFSGSYDYLCYQYGGLNLKHKNALWDAFRLKNPDLWSKLIKATHAETVQPVFQCIIPIGIPHEKKLDYLQMLYPNALFMSAKAWAMDGKLPDNAFERQRILTTFQHHLSMYARQSRVVVLTGNHIIEDTRNELVNIVKNLRGKLSYYFFDTLLEDAVVDNLSQPNPIPEPEIRLAHKLLRYPHPWESHEWYIVTDMTKPDSERIL